MQPGMHMQYDAVIVGAGFAGLYMLHKLRQAGRSAIVLEAGSGVGGTWFSNRYPGCRCDAESLQYSYSFSDELQQEWQWSERFYLRAASWYMGANIPGKLSVFMPYIVAVANGGDNMVNSVKQAHEFGITQRLAVLAANALSVAKAGLDSMQGVMMVEAFYWDLNDGTRAFDKRIRPLLTPGYFPNSLHAGAYAAVRHYLKAAGQMGVAAAKASGRAAVAAMERMPTDDDCFGKGQVRVDGRCMRPFYLFEVKTPAESRGFADVLKLVATTPIDQAFRSLSESTCPLVRG